MLNKTEARKHYRDRMPLPPHSYTDDEKSFQSISPQIAAQKAVDASDDI